MPIYASASSGTKYTPAPAGSHAAVCVDVVDLGTLEVTYQGKTKKQHKIEIVWQIDEERDDGKPFTVKKRYTLSLHEKAGLRKDLEAWRGRPFTETELEGFDVETVISVGAMLSVIHNVSGNNTYANVNGVMRLHKGMQAPAPRDYVRVCDRTPEQQGEQGECEQAQPFGNITDDDVPF